jgi:hypothetical protein
MRLINAARPAPCGGSRKAGLKSDRHGGTISFTDSGLPHSGSIHRMPPVEVTVEADDPHPGWAVTSRRGSHVRRHVFIATRSLAEREADALVAQRNWRRRR